MMDSFGANHVGVTMSDFCKNLKASNEVMLESAKKLGDFDGLNAAFGAGTLLPIMFCAKAKLPGRDLPESPMVESNLQVGDL
jgi:hypothetical protein